MTDKAMNADRWVLQYCPECIQMTNHGCLKCAASDVKGGGKGWNTADEMPDDGDEIILWNNDGKKSVATWKKGWTFNSNLRAWRLVDSPPTPQASTENIKSHDTIPPEDSVVQKNVATPPSGGMADESIERMADEFYCKNGRMPGVDEFIAFGKLVRDACSHPLRLPEKIEPDTEDCEADIAFADGWNNCLTRIRELNEEGGRG